MSSNLRKLSHYQGDCTPANLPGMASYCQILVLMVRGRSPKIIPRNVSSCGRHDCKTCTNFKNFGVTLRPRDEGSRLGIVYSQFLMISLVSNNATYSFACSSSSLYVRDMLASRSERARRQIRSEAREPISNRTCSAAEKWRREYKSKLS
jgi:hypothetical protein